MDDGGSGPARSVLRVPDTRTRRRIGLWRYTNASVRRHCLLGRWARRRRSKPAPGAPLAKGGPLATADRLQRAARRCRWRSGHERARRRQHGRQSRHSDDRLQYRRRARDDSLRWCWRGRRRRRQWIERCHGHRGRRLLERRQREHRRRTERRSRPVYDHVVLLWRSGRKYASCRRLWAGFVLEVWRRRRRRHWHEWSADRWWFVGVWRRRRWHGGQGRHVWLYGDRAHSRNRRRRPQRLQLGSRRYGWARRLCQSGRLGIHGRRRQRVLQRRRRRRWVCFFEHRRRHRRIGRARLISRRRSRSRRRSVDHFERDRNFWSRQERRRLVHHCDRLRLKFRSAAPFSGG